MVRSLTLVLGAGFLIASAHGELQLTPRLSEYKADGATLKHLEFSDGGKSVTYQPPRGWDYFGSATRLTLSPPNRPQAEATISRIPLSQPGSFDDESVKKLVSDAVAMVPKGSENNSVVSQEKGPLMIQGKETFLLTLRYTFYGQKYGRSILFLNRGNEQIRFQLTCHEADFNELHRVFLRSHYSWREL